MPLTRSHQTDCAYFDQLLDARVDGRPLLPAEQAFFDDHTADCPECRAAVAALDLLRDDGSCGALPILDELSVERIAEQVVQHVEREPIVAPAPSRVRPLLIGVAAASLIIGMTGVLWSWLRTSEDAHIVEPPQQLNTVLLVSGVVESDGSPVTAGNRLHPGSDLHVASGNAVYSPVPGVTVFLNAGTHARTTAADPRDEVGFELTRGEVLASIVGNPGRFSITTSRGTIVVTGTLFSVLADDRQVEVETVKGRVEVREPKRKPRAVVAGQRTQLGHHATSKLDPDRAETLHRRAQVLNTLSAPNQVVTVKINSVPGGVEVNIDGQQIGRTPLTTVLSPGDHRLELTLDGYADVEEWAHCHAGEAVEWEFTLHEIAPTAERHSENPPPRPTADGLLKTAQRLRAGGDWPGAARTYRTLIRRFPQSSQAFSARVLLGALELDHLGNPKRALTAFERYLASGRQGPLAQEAAYGRIRALEQLGRHDAEQRAIEAFLRNYPLAVQAPRLRSRLGQLQK